MVSSNKPVVIIRTMKNETVIGADKDMVKRLAQDDEYWFRKGKGGMLQFVEADSVLPGTAQGDMNVEKEGTQHSVGGETLSISEMLHKATSQ